MCTRVQETFSDPALPIMLFAPDNAAVARFTASLSPDNLHALENNSAVLAALVAFHSVSGTMVPLAAVAPGQQVATNAREVQVRDSLQQHGSICAGLMMHATCLNRVWYAQRLPNAMCFSEADATMTMVD